MIQCLCLRGLPKSMCNTEQKHFPLCDLQLCEFDFPPYREDRCHKKFFLRPVAQRLGWNFLVMRDKTESQFDQYKFYGNYVSDWYIDEDNLEILWQEGA